VCSSPGATEWAHWFKSEGYWFLRKPIRNTVLYGIYLYAYGIYGIWKVIFWPTLIYVINVLHISKRSLLKDHIWGGKLPKNDKTRQNRQYLPSYNMAQFVQYCSIRVKYDTAYYTNTPYDTSLAKTICIYRYIVPYCITPEPRDFFGGATITIITVFTRFIYAA
jgi:hypothetical protein